MLAFSRQISVKYTQKILKSAKLRVFVKDLTMIP